MKILCLMIITMMLSLSTFAKSPFHGISGKSLVRGDDCSATTLLEEAIISAGVNILDEHPSNIWTCKSKQYPKCPKAGVTCYSNSNSGFPGICVENPRVVTLNKKYAGEGKIEEKRARFDSLYVIKNTAAGYSHYSSWQMEDGGCHPKEAYATYRNGSGPVDLKECIENFNALVTGSYMWGSNISKDKYCDATKANDSSYTRNYRIRVEEIARCFQTYPHLLDEYEGFRNPASKGSEKKGSKVTNK